MRELEPATAKGFPEVVLVVLILLNNRGLLPRFRNTTLFLPGLVGWPTVFAPNLTVMMLFWAVVELGGKNAFIIPPAGVGEGVGTAVGLGLGVGPRVGDALGVGD